MKISLSLSSINHKKKNDFTLTIYSQGGPFLPMTPSVKNRATMEHQLEQQQQQQTYPVCQIWDKKEVKLFEKICLLPISDFFFDNSIKDYHSPIFFFSFLTVSVHSANDSKTFSLNYFFFGNIYIILISMSYMYQSSIW